MSGARRLSLVVTILSLAAVLMTLAAAPAAAAEPAVEATRDPVLGPILVDSGGMTLYQFITDTDGKSHCFGNCAKHWPPLTVPEGTEPTGGRGVTGDLGTIERPDGSLQVTYNDQPLYLNVNDFRPGDTFGQARNDRFFVVPVSGPPPTFAVPTKDSSEVPTIELIEVPPLGTILTDSGGMTLYQFMVDDDGKSHCFGNCAKYWPPLTVPTGREPTGVRGVTGDLGTIQRPDGSLQVTYNGQPLYLNVNDSKPGDAVGQARNDNFFVVPVSGPPPRFAVSGEDSPEVYTVQSIADDALGTILVESEGMTLYQFTTDTDGSSHCYGNCAKYWPPLTVPAGSRPTAGPGVTGSLGTIERPDGSLQVTYNGQPLYLNVNDIMPGDTFGQARNDNFFVVPVAGAPPETAAPEKEWSQTPTVGLIRDEELGTILVDAGGMTLYLYNNDQLDRSNCTGQCAVMWPPLAVDDGAQPIPGTGITADLGVLERSDGINQVTFEGIPLYLYSKDYYPGDAEGQGVDDWFIAQLEPPKAEAEATVVPAAQGPTIELLEDPVLGTILVDSGGMTLYLHNNDQLNQSNCTGGCAQTWPPLAVDDGVQPIPGDGITAQLGVLERADGINQVTFEGIPLYLYSKDYYPGDAEGQDVEDWFVAQIEPPKAQAQPTGAPAPQLPTVEMIVDPTLGTILVDSDGMTLYLYTNDQLDQSNCTGQCAQTWPPLAVDDGVQPIPGAGITAQLGVLERSDGINQVTFAGVPLYLYSKDYFPGDAEGQGVDDWLVAQLEPPETEAQATSVPAGQQPTVELIDDPNLGTILVGAGGMTLYLYANDQLNESNCTGQCAEMWPPLAVDDGVQPVPGAGITAQLGVLERSDGINQVTFAGVPLYLYSKDYFPGDAEGQGMDDWFVAELE